jgi:hypothetical protein
VDVGRIPKDLDGIVLSGQRIRRRLTVRAEEPTKLVGDSRRGQSGEDAAERPVEVEQ